MPWKVKQGVQNLSSRFKPIFLLIRTAVSIAAPVLLGYAVGTFAALLFLEWLDNLNPGSSTGYLRYRYQFSGFDMFSDTLHPSFFLTIVTAMAYTLVISTIALLWPFRSAFPRRLVGSKMTEKRARCLWRAAIWRVQPVFTRRGLISGLAVGVSAAILSLLIDPWITAIRTELNLNRYMMGQFEPTPGPVVGWFSYVDGACIVIGVAVLAYYRTVKRANHSIRGMPVVRRNWCPRCAYPLEQPLNGNLRITKGNHTRCSECGYSRSCRD